MKKKEMYAAPVTEIVSQEPSNLLAGSGEHGKDPWEATAKGNNANCDENSDVWGLDWDTDDWDTGSSSSNLWSE